ncbi:MAG TPA: bifunctional (p)ppGpp synthetase/guanosine-3',5'-bis(diphosphate) 3'-pyrophosphohydrolase [Thermosynergistes sp.]|nr:bifunctional (p)ppGpp synthetase/guanosine-3',5'-bis(diphosphate) 3'-pyrophosphohydrolase [Thermosynergistes sp.]
MKPKGELKSEDVGIRAVGAETHSGGGKALRLLRDSFIGRLPETERHAAVKLAWQTLWEKASAYLPKEELSQLGEALVLAARAHADQKRATGEPYIIHSIYVATILADMELDSETLMAAILHDALEDTALDPEAIKERFGQSVLTLVDGVTKLGSLPFRSMEEYQAENLRKMFLVMAKDIRVVLIKLADRLHNMRTIQILPREKQIRIARETLEIYAPLSHRLGIYQLKRELEDLAFKVLYPETYYEIRRRVRKKLPEREAIVKQAIDVLAKRFQEVGLKAYITGRAKHFYSIYEKMQRKGLTLDQIYDLLALRVVVGSVAECYQALGIVHTIWKPIPGQFDDYIANPKSNMYQSLHTTIVGPSGEPLEIQIRTWEMHWLAEYGIAAHWRYKEGYGKPDSLDAKLAWIRQVLETQSEGSPPSEFLENLKVDVLSSEVFVFTPKGSVVSLPKGATPVDFAYAIHTEVGHKCVGAMVNGRIVPMNYELQNGDIVRILTSPQGRPSRDWLSIARTGRAKSKIKAYFRQMERSEREDKLNRGRELLEREIRRRLNDDSISLEELGSSLSKVSHDLGYGNGEDLIAAVGAGNQNVSAVASRIAEHLSSKGKSEERPHEPIKREAESEIMVEGTSGLTVTIANCCTPVPGDAIVGYVTRNRGITAHRKDCPNIQGLPEEKMVSLSWGKTNSGYTARLYLEAIDRAGLFADVTQAINAAEGVISAIKAHVVEANRARMSMEIQVKDVGQLYKIMARLNAVDSVINVSRG